MPKVTKESASEFVKKHVELLDATDEQKLSEGDQFFQKALKNTLADEQAVNAINRGLDEVVEKLRGMNSDPDAYMGHFTKALIDGLYKSEIKNTSMLPLSIFGVAGAVTGKYLGGKGMTGLLCAAAGLFTGAILGTYFVDKPEPKIMLFAVLVARGFSQRLPEAHDKIMKATGENLFNKCHLWADMHGGWSEGISNTVNLNAVHNALPELLTPSRMNCVIL